jgi:penicillin-binding protein 1A
MGIYIGYDNPQPMGDHETGGGLAAPVFADFFKLTLKDKPAIPFRKPDNIRIMTVNKNSGLPTTRNDPDAIEEAFKPGTEPEEGSYATAGYQGGEQQQPGGWGSPQPSAPAPGGWGASPQPSAAGYPPPYGRQAPGAGTLY